MSDLSPSVPTLPGVKPRILLLTSQYFLIGEIESACKRLGVDHLLLDFAAREMDLDMFVSLIVEALSSFKPDIVLTVNHLGVDREGVLSTLLGNAKVPLASWFVDNPHLLLGHYQDDARNTVLFTWDADTLESLGEMGYAHVHYLPLAADPYRLKPSNRPVPEEWKSEVSFVGNSMLTKTLKRLRAARPSPRLAEAGLTVAQAFGESDERSVRRFMSHHYPELTNSFEELETTDRKLAFETFLTWQATLVYRRDCVLRTLDFSPLIVGDNGWKQLLKGQPNWRHHAELNYYGELPDFYRAGKINFNCTSRQMKGAVNQRVFDVPSCGAFLLTDYRRQLEELFEPGREIVFYNHPDEIPAMLETYLEAPDKRQQVADAARKRVMAEHTYDHRLVTLMRVMGQTFH